MVHFYSVLVGICILFLASISIAQDGQSCKLQAARLAADGTCDAEFNATCRDTCTGRAIVNETDCEDAKHCCFREKRCILLRSTTLDTSTPLNVDTIGEDFMDKFRTQGRDDILSRNLVLGGFSSFNFCPTFPQTCNVQYTTPEDIQPTVNIPYCQRVACTNNPVLEFDVTLCLTQPGCFFDFQLFQYRNFLGQAILPGVPVCHLAIRNKAFHKHVNNYLQQNFLAWNPLLTSCFLREYETEIFGGDPGCKSLNVLRHFGTAKRAGWESITDRECYLISGCWNDDEFACYYPVDNDDVNVPSGLPIHIHQYDTFGHALCLPFEDNLKGGSFLDQYHSCLTAGCSTTVGREGLLNALYEVSSTQLPLLLQHQYWTLAIAGEVRADNWKESAERLIGSHSTPQSALNQLRGQGPIGSPIRGPGFSLQGFSLNASDPNGLFPMFGTFVNQLNTTQSMSSASIGQLGAESLSAIGNFGGPASLQALLTAAEAAIRPKEFTIEPTCPYQNIFWPGVLPLIGNFEGCCSKPKCYLDRTALRMPFSGVAPYITQWTSWNRCTVPCNGGIQTRTRTCVGKIDCSDITTEQTQQCNLKLCPPWTEWTNWGTCTKTCRGGQRIRRRFCSSGTSCQGPAMERLPCNTNKCARFGKWGKWSRCSVQCGEGVQRRTRKCMADKASCVNNVNESKKCEAFCGMFKYENSGCNLVTCVSTRVPTCLKRDGTEGYCRQTNMKTLTQKCYQDQCFCKHIPTANRCRTRGRNNG